MPTPIANLPFIDANQNQKYLTVNEAFTRHEIIASHSCISMALTSPPSSPSNGDSYIIASPSNGLWSGLQNSLATWADYRWIITEPDAIKWLFDENTSSFWHYSGGAWVNTNSGNLNLDFVNGTASVGYKWLNNNNVNRVTHKVTPVITGAFTTITTIPTSIDVIRLDFTLAANGRTFHSALGNGTATNHIVVRVNSGVLEYYVGTNYTPSYLVAIVEYA